MVPVKVFAAFLLVLPLSQAYEANNPLPKFAPCQDQFLSAIKAYWNTEGRPENVLKQIQDSGQFAALMTSYTYLNSNNKCIFMDASDENKTLTFTFMPKDNSQPGVISYNIKVAEDGSLYDEEKDMRWYTYALLDGLQVNYVCSVHAGSPQVPPLASIFLAKNKFNILTQPLVNNFRQTLTTLGINFTYSYGSECFDKPSSGFKLPGLG